MKGDPRKYGPLNPAPPVDSASNVRGRFTKNALKPLEDVLTIAREAVRKILEKGLPTWFQGQGAMAFWVSCLFSRDGHSEWSQLPKQVRLAFDLDMLLDRIESDRVRGITDATVKTAFLAGALAVRLHVSPLNSLLRREGQRMKLESLQLPEDRMIEGGNIGRLNRLVKQRGKHLTWQKRARELWRENPDRSTLDVAKQILAELGTEAPPGLSTIRRLIGPFRPAH